MLLAPALRRTKEKPLLRSAIGRLHSRLIEVQYNLGVIYFIGFGVKKDEEKASYWYRRATDREYAAAQYNLGIMYEYGQSIERNEATAFQCYRLVANQGLVEAQYKLTIIQQRRIQELPWNE